MGKGRVDEWMGEEKEGGSEGEAGKKTGGPVSSLPGQDLLRGEVFVGVAAHALLEAQDHEAVVVAVAGAHSGVE